MTIELLSFVFRLLFSREDSTIPFILMLARKIEEGEGYVQDESQRYSGG